MSEYSEHLISMAGGDGDVLARIEARVEAATEGPWNVDNEERTVRAREYAGEIMFDRSTNHPAEWAPYDSRNAEFIAHARTDVPYLLELARDQQAALDRVIELAHWAGKRGWTLHPAEIRNALEVTK